MTAYIITIETSSESVREKVRTQLKTYGGYCPILKDSWAISNAATSSVQIRDSLTGLLDPNDRIFVIRSGTEAAWAKAYSKENSDWLMKNL